MKKKLALILSLCFVVFALAACGTDPESVDYNGLSYSDLENYSTSLVTQLSGYSSDDLDSMISGGNLDETRIDMVQKWKDTVADIGSFEGTGDFSIDKSGKTLTTTLIVHYEVRDINFQVVINYNDMSITGYSIEPVYSLGEKMSKAGLNTVISMSIVFCVLIIISLVIYAFKIFPYLESKKKAEQQAQEEADVPAKEEQVQTAQLTDDTELVAVIAAAIAASTGTSTSDFVVRSINRR